MLRTAETPSRVSELNLGSPLQGTPGPQLPPGRKCLLVVGRGPSLGVFPRLQRPQQQLASVPLSLRASSPYNLPLCSETPTASPSRRPPSESPSAEPCARPHQSCFSLWFSWSLGVSAASCSCCFMIIPCASVFSVT